MLRFDLQAHSTHSDGALPAAEVVRRAADAGVQLLALTDHDTVSGVSEALAEAESAGLRLLPAVEISSIDDGAGGEDGPGGDVGARERRELHILGYAIDHEGPELTRRLEEFLSDREARTLRMAAALEELGFELDRTELSERQAAGKPIGRPHVAAAVLNAPANASRLRDEQIDDVGSLIRGYLIEGRPAFRLRETPTVAQAIAAIHDAGGVAVWAHPFWDISEDEEVLDSLERFHALGIDGVEAFYITHTREQTQLLADRAGALGMLTTGSADFHGPENRQFSRFLAFDTYGIEPNLGPLG
jgi:predicted metal-dependent phosphoesterase TrpH